MILTRKILIVKKGFYDTQNVKTHCLILTGCHFGQSWRTRLYFHCFSLTQPFQKRCLSHWAYEESVISCLENGGIKILIVSPFPSDTLFEMVRLKKNNIIIFKIVHQLCTKWQPVKELDTWWSMTGRHCGQGCRRYLLP